LIVKDVLLILGFCGDCSYKIDKADNENEKGEMNPDFERVADGTLPFVPNAKALTCLG